MRASNKKYILPYDILVDYYSSGMYIHSVISSGENGSLCSPRCADNDRCMKVVMPMHARHQSGLSTYVCTPLKKVGKTCFKNNYNYN